MCNSGVIDTEEPLPRMNLAFKFIHCCLNMASVLVAITLNHSQCFMAANLLDRWQINSCLNQLRHCRMTQSMANYLFWV